MSLPTYRGNRFFEAVLFGRFGRFGGKFSSFLISHNSALSGTFPKNRQNGRMGRRGHSKLICCKWNSNFGSFRWWMFGYATFLRKALPVVAKPCASTIKFPERTSVLRKEAFPTLPLWPFPLVMNWKASPLLRGCKSHEAKNVSQTWMCGIVSNKCSKTKIKIERCLHRKKNSNPLKTPQRWHGNAGRWEEKYRYYNYPRCRFIACSSSAET